MQQQVSDFPSPTPGVTHLPADRAMYLRINFLVCTVPAERLAVAFELILFASIAFACPRTSDPLTSEDTHASTGRNDAVLTELWTAGKYHGEGEAPLAAGARRRYYAHRYDTFYHHSQICITQWGNQLLCRIRSDCLAFDFLSIGAPRKPFKGCRKRLKGL